MEVYERHAWYPVKKYGYPFVTCRNCGFEFRDTEFIEPALVPPKKYVCKAVRKEAVLLSIIPALLGFVALPGSVLAGVVLLLIAAMIIVIEAATHGNRERKMHKLLEESQNRLRDPSYVRKLLAYKFKVPKKYLKAAHIDSEGKRTVTATDKVKALCSLKELLDDGVLTDEEFQEQKKKIMNSYESADSDLNEEKERIHAG